MHTVSDLINRFIEEMNGVNGQIGVRPLGSTHLYGLRRLSREPIGQKVAQELRKQDFIEHAKERLKVVCAATINQDITMLAGVLKYAPSAWDDCEEVSAAAVEAAKPFLAKHGYIAKSNPRKRRPQPVENGQLAAYFEEQNKHARTRVDMVEIAAWQLRSSRRISESCRLLWTDWNKEDQTILVRAMKHPKKKNNDKLVALTSAAHAMLLELEKRRPAPEATDQRIFPYNSKTCSQRYTIAKKRLGIEGLRLHDSRRDCGTRLVEDDGYSVEQAILVTGHETTTIFQRNYLAQDAAKFKLGPRNAAESS